MNRLSKPGSRVLAGALALVMAFILAAPPVGAAEVAAGTDTPTSDNSTEPAPTLMAMADAKVQATDPADAVAPPEVSEAGSGKPFLKTPQGIAAVVLLVAGTVLVAYSRSNDRPTSPVR